MKKGKLMERINEILESGEFDEGQSFRGIIESEGRLTDRERAIYTCIMEIFSKIIQIEEDLQVASSLAAQEKLMRDYAIFVNQLETTQKFFWFQVADRLGLWERIGAAFGIIGGKFVTAIDPVGIETERISIKRVESIDDFSPEVREKLTQFVFSSAAFKGGSTRPPLDN